MIYLYDSTETDFRYNGKPLPIAYDVTVSNTLNSEYYVMGKYPLDKDKVYKEIVEDRIIKVHTMDGMEPFRIVSVNKQELYVEFEAWPLFYADMRNKLVKPLNLKGVSGQTALNSFKNNLLIDTPFDFYSDITDNHDYHTQDENERENNPKQLYNALDVFKTIVNRWGGELWIRGYDIRVNKRIGTDTESMLYEKKNITEFVDTTNIEGIVTRLHGKSEWQDERQEGEEEGQKHSIEVTVDSPLINDYSGVVFEKQFTNNDIRTEQELKNWLNLKFTTENIDKPQRTIEVGTNVIDETKIGFADTLILKYIKHDTDVRIKVVGYEYDGFANELKHVVLGQPKHTSSSTIGNTITDLVNNVVEPVDRKTTIAMNSADGKSTVFHGTADPNALNLNAKENDTYFRTNGSEKEIWRFTGTLWELIMDTSDTTKNADAIEEQKKDIDEAKKVADDAVNEINTAVENAGFTSLDETIGHVDSIANNAQTNAQQAITDASNAFSAAQTAISGLDDKVDTSVYNAALLDLESDIDLAITAGNTAKETAEGLITQVESIGTVANSAKQDAEDAVSKANAAKTSADNLSTEVSGLKTDVEGFELTVNNYQDQVSQFSADVNGFQSTVASYETEVDEFGNIVSTNTTQLNELRNDIDGFESLLASYDEDLTGFNTTVSSFRNTLEGLESTVASYETEVDEYGNEVATYATELSTLRNTVNGFESTVAEFDTTVTGYQTSLATLTNTVDGFESTVANYEVQVDEYGNEVASYATEVATLENTVDGFNSLVASFEEEAEGYSAAVSEFRNTVSGLQSTVASYEVELDEFGNTVDSYATEVSTLTNTVSGFESTVANYTTEVNELGEEVESYATEVATLTNTVSGFQSTVSKVEQDYEDVSGTVAAHTTSISNMNGQIALKANTTTVSALTGRVTTAETGITANANAIKLKAATTTVNDLTGRVKTAETSITANAKAIALKASTTDVSELTGRVDTAETSITANAKAIGLRATTATVNTLTGRVSTAETNITANADAIKLKASTTAVNTLTGRVTTAESSIKANATAITQRLTTTQVNTLVDGKGFAKETSVSTRFNDIQSTVDGTTQTIAKLRTDVNGKATITQFNTLNSTVNGTITRVGNAEGKITKIETNVSGLQTTVADKASQSEVTQLSDSYNIFVGGMTSKKNLLPRMSYGSLSSVDGSEYATSGHFRSPFIRVDPYVHYIASKNGEPVPFTVYGYSGSGSFVSKSAESTSSKSVTAAVRFVRIVIQDAYASDDFQYEKGTSVTPYVPYLGNVGEAQISLMEDNINLRVAKGDLVSQINIEAGRTLIQSNKILLNAFNTVITGTTWMDGAVIKTASITNAKIKDATISSAKIAGLDVSKISGNTSEFIRSTWNGISSSVEITSAGIELGYLGTVGRLTSQGYVFVDNGAAHGRMSILHATDDTGVFKGKKSVSLGAEPSAYLSFSTRRAAGDSSFTRTLGVIGGDVYMSGFRPSTTSTVGVQAWLGTVGGVQGIHFGHSNSNNASIFFANNGDVYIKSTSGSYSIVRPNFASS